MSQIEFFVLLAALAAVIVLQVLAMLRSRASPAADLAERIERVEREVRMQLQTTAQTSNAATVQQFEAMRRQLEAQGLVGRNEQARSLKVFADTMHQRMEEIRGTLETKIKDLQADNGMRLEEALEHEFTYGWDVFASQDAKEGPRAFKEKRKPNFQGK